jgi:hypothetical protein
MFTLLCNTPLYSVNSCEAYSCIAVDFFSVKVAAVFSASNVMHASTSGCVVVRAGP